MVVAALKREPRTGYSSSVLAPLITVVVLFLGWQLAASGLPARVVPAPMDVLRRLISEVAEGNLLGYTWHTLWLAIAGSLVGLAVGTPLAVVISQSRWVAAALSPLIAASQAIPAVALAPVLVIWFGYGTIPIVLLCALMVFFPITINAVLGLTSVDSEIIGAAKLDGAGRLRLLRSIEFPLAIPAVLTGIRAGFVLSVTGSVVGEFVMGGQGLGLLISVYRDRSDTTGLFAVLVVLASLAIAIFLLIRSAERSIPWNQN